MKTAFKLVAGALAAIGLLIFGVATLTAGGRWDSQALPIPGVTFVLDTGERTTGELTIDWNGDHHLRTPDSVIKLSSQESLRADEQIERLSSQRGWWNDFSHWRLWLPITLLWILIEVVGQILGARSQRQAR